LISPGDTVRTGSSSSKRTLSRANMMPSFPRKLVRLAPKLATVLGLVALSYLLGAVVVYFRLPPYEFLRRAFLGGQEVLEQLGSSTTSPSPTINEDTPER